LGVGEKDDVRMRQLAAKDPAKTTGAQRVFLIWTYRVTFQKPRPAPWFQMKGSFPIT
jgi:hypothetical protein